MPIGARSKAISKRRSASRPARSAQRCSVTSRETTTIPSMRAVRRAHRRALDDDGAPRMSENGPRRCPPARPARRRGSARWRRAARQERSPIRGGRPSRRRRCRRSAGERPPAAGSAGPGRRAPTDAPGRCCSASRWRRSLSRRASSATRRALSCSACPSATLRAHRPCGSGDERSTRALPEDGNHPMVIGGRAAFFSDAGAPATARRRGSDRRPRPGPSRNGEWSLSRRCVVPARAAIASCAGTGIALSRSQMT